MRKTYKTSTAIVTILSLLMPTVTFAQETPAEQDPAAQTAEAPAAAAEAPAAAADAPAAEAQPKKAKKAAAEEAAPAEAPAADEKPAEKPAEVKAEAPEAKPADAAEKADKAEAIAKEAEKKPVKAEREAVETTAPEAKPAAAKPAAAEPAAAAVEKKAEAVKDKAVKAADTAKAKVEETVAPAEGQAAATDDLKKALDAQADKATAAADKAAETAKAADAAKAAGAAKAALAATSAEATKAASESEDALKKALQAEADKGKAKVDEATAAANDAAGKTAATKDATPVAADGKTDGKTVPPVEEASAPEAAAQETDAAIAAANPKKVEPNDALQALLAGKTGDGKITDVTVSSEDARRSDQDFETSVSKSITEALGTKTEAKKDNTGRDLARLALVGMAGYAVGTMLSNNRQVALNTGDRVVVTNPDGSQQLIKNDDALLFRPGSNVQTEKFSDGSTITTVLREDGSKVMTIRDANMNVLRRSVVWPDGRQTMLIDDTVDVKPVRVSELPPPARPIAYDNNMSEEALRQALMQESRVDRRFSLDQIRDIAQVRALVAPLDIQSITFATGSSAIRPEQARQLSALGRAIAESIRKNPGELFLIEGYTDAVGSAASNLALSDRRAESVALALTEYFDVAPENLVVQGYGKQFLKIQTDGPEEANRRVAVRRITDLIEQK